ncbi:hypothetical protein DPMN_122405 [Dreissena polymorpha]|uniref:Uncharacterized protein n=1 Tax=Dreissena polymorpha TaxID=45954 RepID=A0A9D4JUG1_DREPO|nr:hypothetical protein DPMN_122405 [Dreissena polymorpha]
MSDASDTTIDYDVQIPVQQNQNEQRMSNIPRRRRRTWVCKMHGSCTGYPQNIRTNPWIF